MQYCPSTEPFWPAWKYHGFSRCFYETVGPSAQLIFLCICCFTSHWSLLCSRAPVHLPPATPASRPKTFLVQIVLSSLVIPAVILTRFILLATYLGSENGLSWYMLVCGFTSMASWPLSLRLAFSERRRTITPLSTGGHSVPLLIFYAGTFAYYNLMFLNWNSKNWWFHDNNIQDTVELVIFVAQYVLSGFMLFLAFLAPGLPTSRGLVSARHLQYDDRQAFLETGEPQRRSAFSNFFHKLGLLLPFIWPKKNVLLQFQVLLCILLLLCGRAIAVFVPIVNKKIINSLASADETVQYCWKYILIYVALWYCQGQGGNSFFSNCRSFLWIRVQQYTVKSVESEVYSHLHNLSLRWHLNRKTGEVLRICDRGTSSVTNLLNYILFNIFPTVADIIIAVVYFTSAFNAWFGLIVFLTMAVYLAVTVVVTEWRTKFRRAMNKKDNAAEAKAVDALLNFETVKYYNAEDYEVETYKHLIDEYQKCEWSSSASMALLNTLQSTVITLGVMAGSLLCAHMVADHTLTVGDYVLFSSYLLQLYTPLNFFGTYYRLIQTAFVDMENMFDLLKVEPEVNDVMNAPPLKVSGGEVQFKNVHFHYLPERPVLKNVSFVIPSGSTVALVGPSGSGKSTIIRLLFRLYDVCSGTIFFDSQDIRQVQQKSLRKNIGVVPQDTVLFNDSIRYNIRYGRIEADDLEIEEAARAADIHDQILTFPSGYETVVGERGLKLSGGEKQRVAIARTVLKNPPMVLLDEATSSLDTQTERNIQTSLTRMCANRTTLVVAHRLSTIVGADVILVLKNGEIVERGRHEELLALEGLYSSMWQQQQKEKETESSVEANSEETNSNETPKQ